MVPQTQFVLLTQESSHEELTILDSPNMRRFLVVGSDESNNTHPNLLEITSRAKRPLPARLKRVLKRWVCRLNGELKCSDYNTLMSDIGADLLFCPFNGIKYFEAGIPCVCTIYDLQYKTYPEFFTAENVYERDHAFIDSCHRATVLAAISDYTRDSAIAHGNLDPERIRTIYLRMAQRIAPEVKQDKNILSRLGLRKSVV